MSGRQGGGRRVLLPPINFIFRLLQEKNKVCVWLYEQHTTRIEGHIRGFDEFMNLVLEDATEIKTNAKTGEVLYRKPFGRILLKGDNVALIHAMT